MIMMSYVSDIMNINHTIMSLSHVLWVTLQKSLTYHGNQLGKLQLEMNGDGLADVGYRSH